MNQQQALEWPHPPLPPGPDFDVNQVLALVFDESAAREDWISWASERQVLRFPSADHPDDDPAPRFSEPATTRHRNAWLIAGCDAIQEILGRSTDAFGNAPYAPIGGNAFMLALDPVIGDDGKDSGPHARQRAFVQALLARYEDQKLDLIAVEAVRQASVAALQRDRFDLAAFAEHSALRFCQLWFGYAADDLAFLRAAAADGYRALVHQIIGRHFCCDSTVLPQARQAMAALARRSGALIAEYRKLEWQPREARGQLKRRLARLGWPEGVDPSEDWGLAAMGPPMLKQIALDPGDFSIQELAMMAVGLVVGTVGNAQAGSCLVIERLMSNSSGLQAAKKSTEVEAQVKSDALLHQTRKILAEQPPVAFLARRALTDINLGVMKETEKIRKGDDVLLWMTAAARGGNQCAHSGFAFGNKPPGARHACVGEAAGLRLTTEIVRAVLSLPGLDQVCDPVTGKPKGLKQRWGFACLSYPLQHRRARRLVQQPLNVVMRVKTPVDQHAEALRMIIRSGAPRIERALKNACHVHFAWFELLDQGRWLALHTVYDGDFDGYVQHFALEVDDLFDRLFEHIENAPPLPVAENPGAFVDVIRAHHQPQLEGYFFSAYPRTETADVMLHERGR